MKNNIVELAALVIICFEKKAWWWYKSYWSKQALDKAVYERCCRQQY